jgi:thiol-disulfide isomerase/thioredoxin
VSLGSQARRALTAALFLALASACNPSIGAPGYNAVKDPSLVTAAALAPCPTTGQPVTGGLPKITLHCLDGNGTVDLAGVRGPALINVWASNCGPCIKEAPAIERFREAAKGKVLVLGIDSEPFPDDGLSFARKVGLHYASVIDEHTDVNGKLKLVGYPTSYFLDAAGHLIGPAQSGAFGSIAAIKAAVKAHLGVSVP